MITTKVVGVNINLSRAVALSESGDYILFEMFGNELEFGTTISGNFNMHPLGNEYIRDHQNEITIEVSIQDYANKTIAEQYLNGRC